MREDEFTGQEEDSLPAPLGPVRELRFTGESLGGLRHALAAWASEEQLDPQRVDDLVLAVNELTTNSVRHGGGGGTLRLWRESGTLVCEVQDDGHIERPLMGETLPPRDASRGRGMWLVHRLCDLVQIRSSAEGSVVRVHTHLP